MEVHYGMVPVSGAHPVHPVHPANPSGDRAQKRRSQDSGTVLAMESLNLKSLVDTTAQVMKTSLALPASSPSSPAALSPNPAVSALDRHLQIETFRVWASTRSQHRQSISVDSGVAMDIEDAIAFEDRAGRSPLKDHLPHRPPSTFRFSGYMFSPSVPGSPASSPSRPSSPSESSQEWDLICIGQDGQGPKHGVSNTQVNVHAAPPSSEDFTDSSVDQVRAEMEAVSLNAASFSMPRPFPDLETIPEVDDSDATLDTDTDAVSTLETDQILDFCLPTVRGINTSDVPTGMLEVCKSVTYAYAERIAAIVDGFQDFSITSRPSDAGTSPGSSGTTSRQASSHPPDKSAGAGRGGGKSNRNKKRRLDDEGNGDGDDDQDYGSVSGDPRESGEELRPAVKLRCIFRARNPTRFNVRDHTSCAMTMFTKFSDLRKHILTKHALSSPDAATCQRCKQGYPSQGLLELHLKNEACTYRLADPEDGISSETAAKIRFRGRDCGALDEDQWKHLWQLVFPDDQDDKVESYNFIPVLEHHELEPVFLNKLEYLKPVVQNFAPDDTQFNELILLIKALFDSAVNDLTTVGRRLGIEYENRQGSRTSRASRPIHQSLEDKFQSRDSGIALEQEVGMPRTSARFSSMASGSRPNSVTPLSQMRSFSSDTPSSTNDSRPQLRPRTSFTPLQPAPIAPLPKVALRFSGQPMNICTDESTAYPPGQGPWYSGVTSLPTSAEAMSDQQMQAFDSTVMAYQSQFMSGNTGAGQYHGQTAYDIGSPTSAGMFRSQPGETHIDPAQLCVNYEQLAQANAGVNSQMTAQSTRSVMAKFKGIAGNFF